LSHCRSGGNFPTEWYSTGTALNPPATESRNRH